MFADPESTVSSVGKTVSLLRDGVITLGVVVVGWKIRDGIQPLIDFFKKSNGFMDHTTIVLTSMEKDMKLVLHNHIPHMAADIHAIAEKNGVAVTDIQIPSDPSTEV